jgi:predicted permease
MLNDQLPSSRVSCRRSSPFPARQISRWGLAEDAQAWTPFAIREVERSENSFAAIAKLARRVGRRVGDRAARDPERFAAGIQARWRWASTSSHCRIRLPAHRATRALLWTAIATVLLIACGNITNLLLVRGSARGPELAVRSALGASRATLIRHSLVDSLTLAAIGGTSGLLVALWVLPLILRFAPANLPRLDEVVVNGRALAFAAVVTIGTGVLVGLLPARRAAQTNLIDRLKQSARAGSGGRRDRSIRSLTIVAQAALTVACLGAAGLIVRSLENVLEVDRGFQSERILAVDVSLSPGRYATRDARAAFAREVLGRLQAVPGATAAGFVSKPPLSGISMNTVVVVEGTEETPIPLVERPMGDVRSADAGYFRTLGIPLLEGSLFDERDVKRPVAVISSAMARRAWPGQNAIGKRFRLTYQPARLVEVVGVVGDVRNMGLETTPTLAVYLLLQVFLNGSSFVVRWRVIRRRPVRRSEPQSQMSTVTCRFRPSEH